MGKSKRDGVRVDHENERRKVGNILREMELNEYEEFADELSEDTLVNKTKLREEKERKFQAWERVNKRNYDEQEGA